MKSLAVWLAETACEIPLLMALLFLIDTLTGGAAVAEGFGSWDLRLLLGAVFVFFVGSGYIITTALAAFVLRRRGVWLYPTTAAVLLILHEHALARGFAPPRPLDLQLQLGGAIIAFVCTFVGGRVWRAWTGASA